MPDEKPGTPGGAHSHTPDPGYRHPVPGELSEDEIHRHIGDDTWPFMRDNPAHAMPTHAVPPDLEEHVWPHPPHWIPSMGVTVGFPSREMYESYLRGGWAWHNAVLDERDGKPPE